MSGDEPFGLVADVDDDLVADDLDDLARDDPADLEVLAVAEEAVEVVRAALGGDDRDELLVADVEFTEQVAIYHVGSFGSKALARIARGRRAGRFDTATSRSDRGRPDARTE